MAKPTPDLIGQKFNKLTVIERADDYMTPKGVRSSRWLCQCECGNKLVVRGSYLKNGNTKSCGCLQKEAASKIGKKNKKYNTYDLTGEYGIGYTTKGDEFYFDLEDYDKIKNHCWHIDNNGYVVSRIANKQFVYMHRFILDVLDDKLDVDHIYHQKNDNRKLKLRVCEHRENCMNVKVQKGSITGVTGVTYRREKCKKKYRVMISIDGECVKIGAYENFDEAVNARLKAEDEHYGEYSFRNSQMRCEDNG